MTGENGLPEKELFEKIASIKIFEYSPLGSELKKETDIAKKQYRRLDKVYEFGKEDDFKKKAKQLTNKYKI